MSGLKVWKDVVDDLPRHCAKQALRFLAQLPQGEEVVIPGREGWEIVLTRFGGGFNLAHRNPARVGQYKFFVYDTTNNLYGAGKIKQEPSLGVACRSCGVEADGAVIGAIVLDAEGKVADRFSWSNIVFAKGGAFGLGSEGDLAVNGVPQGYLHALFLADKNRIEGYVGVFKPVKPEGPVKILEMETLLLASV